MYHLLSCNKWEMFSLKNMEMLIIELICTETVITTEYIFFAL